MKAWSGLMLGLLLLAVAAGSSGAAAPTSTAAGIPEVAEASQDREVIAAMYEAKAAEAKAEAARHSALARMYKRGAPKAPTQQMAKHCAKLAGIMEDAAKAYSALAAEYRQSAEAK